MSEDKAMSRDEMVVGSYVCAIRGGRPRGVVTRVEFDERGPEHDPLHVDTTPGGQPQRCQRVVMMLAEPAPYYEDSPQGLLKRIADLEARNAELEALRLDHEALKSTYAEIDAAYNKAHSERYALNEQNVELRRECDALRARLVALEEGEAAAIRVQRQVAQVAHDRAYEIERQKHEIAHVESREREALAQAAAQRERADMWQGAAQDALDQMAHWRKQAKEKTKLCDMTVGIDFRGTDTAARKLAEVAAAVAPQRDDVRRG